MSLPKTNRFFVLALVPVLFVGLFFALRTNVDRDSAGIPILPGITIPNDEESKPPAVIPEDRDTTKIEYRNVLFNAADVETGAAFAGDSHI